MSDIRAPLPDPLEPFGAAMAMAIRPREAGLVLLLAVTALIGHTLGSSAHWAGFIFTLSTPAALVFIGLMLPVWGFPAGLLLAALLMVPLLSVYSTVLFMVFAGLPLAGAVFVMSDPALSSKQSSRSASEVTAMRSSRVVLVVIGWLSLIFSVAELGALAQGYTLEREVARWIGLADFEGQDILAGGNISDLASTFPAIFLGGLFLWLLMSVKIALFLVRWRKIDTGLRFWPLQAGLPLWFVALTACTAALAALAPGSISFLIANLAMILAVPAMLIGIGLINRVLRGRRFRLPLLCMIYAVLAVATVYGAMLLVLLGLLDTPLKLTSRIDRLSAKPLEA